MSATLTARAVKPAKRHKQPHSSANPPRRAPSRGAARQSGPAELVPLKAEPSLVDCSVEAKVAKCDHTALPHNVDDLREDERPLLIVLQAWRKARAADFGWTDPCLVSFPCAAVLPVTDVVLTDAVLPVADVVLTDAVLPVTDVVLTDVELTDARYRMWCRCAITGLYAK
jgi:hypothetical protein